jgi:ribosomal protein S19E (S16A)
MGLRLESSHGSRQMASVNPKRTQEWYFCGAEEFSSSVGSKTVQDLRKKGILESHDKKQCVRTPIGLMW